jgi:beta-lactamase class A
VRVAHKTGEISTMAHDAGVVYAPNRKPYVIAVLTEWAPEATGRKPTIAEASHAVFELLTEHHASDASDAGDAGDANDVASGAAADG